MARQLQFAKHVTCYEIHRYEKKRVMMFWSGQSEGGRRLQSLDGQPSIVSSSTTWLSRRSLMALARMPFTCMPVLSCSTRYCHIRTIPLSHTYGVRALPCLFRKPGCKSGEVRLVSTWITSEVDELGQFNNAHHVRGVRDMVIGSQSVS